MIGPVLDLMADQASGLSAASRLSFVRSVLRTLTWPFRAGTPRASQASEAPQDPQVPQDGPQRTLTRIFNLINAVGASLQALSGVRSNAEPPQPERDDKEPSDTSAWLFNANMDSLVLDLLGVPLVN